MRVALVGPPGDRARVRQQLASASIVIGGEFSTMAAFHASDLEVEAIVIADAARERRPAGPLRRLVEEEPDPEPLTARERDVLRLLADGLSNKAIATRLGISDQTVKFHVSSIYGKLAAANRTDAVRRALRRGLITL